MFMSGDAWGGRGAQACVERRCGSAFPPRKDLPPQCRRGAGISVAESESCAQWPRARGRVPRKSELYAASFLRTCLPAWLLLRACVSTEDMEQELQLTSVKATATGNHNLGNY